MDNCGVEYYCGGSNCWIIGYERIKQTGHHNIHIKLSPRATPETTNGNQMTDPEVTVKNGKKWIAIISGLVGIIFTIGVTWGIFGSRVSRTEEDIVCLEASVKAEVAAGHADHDKIIRIDENVSDIIDDIKELKGMIAQLNK